MKYQTVIYSESGKELYYVDNKFIISSETGETEGRVEDKDPNSYLTAYIIRGQTYWRDDRRSDVLTYGIDCGSFDDFLNDRVAYKIKVVRVLTESEKKAEKKEERKRASKRASIRAIIWAACLVISVAFYLFFQLNVGHISDGSILNYFILIGAAGIWVCGIGFIYSIVKLIQAKNS